jgi:hypothetical protein
VEDIIQALRIVGHSAVVKRELARAEWRETLWGVVAGAEIGASIRTNALQVLALSLVHEDAMSKEQIGGELDRLLLLLTSVSPEGAMLTSEGLQCASPFDLLAFAHLCRCRQKRHPTHEPFVRSRCDRGMLAVQG